MNSESSTQVSGKKVKIVKELAELMRTNKTIMVASIKSLPSAQYQDIKKKIREKARVKVVKKSLIDFALEHSGNRELEKLVPYITSDFAIIFSDTDAFELSGVLSSEKSPTKAKAGQEAPFDIEVKAGPTELLPGPDISALSAVGLQPRVEGGKISIMQDKILVKAGKKITDEQASIMAKLNIVPFKIGLEPIAAFTEGKVYTNIKIDKELFMDTLLEMYGRALPFAVELGYINETTLPAILRKAVAYEKKLIRIVSGEPEPDMPFIEVKEEKKEEPREEVPNAAAGLASLFG